MKRQRPCGPDRAVRIEDGDARGVQEVAQAEEGPKGCVWIVAQLEGRLRGAHRGRQAGREGGREKGTISTSAVLQTIDFYKRTVRAAQGRAS